MMSVQTHPSYYDIDRGCSVLVHKILNHFTEHERSRPPRGIMGLARGGLIPAVIISHALESLGFKNEVIPVTYSSTKGNGSGKTNILPELSLDNLLIVDDIADGGHTMNEVAEFYKSRSLYVRTAVLYYKESSVHTPTFYWRKIPADSPWIIFPFEHE